MEEKILEVYIFQYCDVKVGVKINYPKNSVSLVEVNDTNLIKKWVFAERGVEYMGGWLEILTAMQEAIKDANKKIKDYQKSKEDFVTDVLMEATDIVKRKGQKLPVFKGKKIK
jgi:predicted transcriptional regulator of viral defense system